ncbi:MAG: glycogen debranching protein GlgX [Anaerolineales bacterium]
MAGKPENSINQLTGISPGKSFPLGATVSADGVNFSLYSKSGKMVELLFFNDRNDEKPDRVIRLDPIKNRTFHYWHVFVPGIRSGQVYGYRVYGPFDPKTGMRFDGEKVLLDPYAKAIAVPDRYNREAASKPGDNAVSAMKNVVVDLSGYDWEGDAPIQRSFAQTVIYEMHVRGFTQHTSSGIDPELRGTYLGLIQKIPYLKNLGITAVELLPVLQFDEHEAPEGLTNYWGYSPVSFFAPHCGYCSKKEPLAALNEFRDMVKALHKARIEVILDVVYNHTAENNEYGPTFCFRGLENGVYYILGKEKSRYANFSGTGNTLNANHSVVRRLIVDSLQYWVEEMHVDGFRFDLASILSRDGTGKPLANPPVLWEIETNPVLAGTKLIAEAWDAAGLYQVGTFIGDRWREWNGKFRDDVRSFMRRDPGMAQKFSSRFIGSPDIYEHEGREPEQSINFITCHDGFTLNDLVSYNRKHNQLNREENEDGSDQNFSWNFGVEGPSHDPEIETLRNRQIKNFLAITLLSLGVPMLLMGDEMRRTQNGNNNAYCQDNEISWVDWSLLEKHADIHRFVRRLIRVRRNLEIFNEDHGLSLSEFLHQAQIEWHGVKLHNPDWGYNSHSLAFTVQARRERFHLIVNAYSEELEFEIPPVPSGTRDGWKRLIDTSCDSPDDFYSWSDALQVTNQVYSVKPHSLVVLALETSQNLAES